MLNRRHKVIAQCCQRVKYNDELRFQNWNKMWVCPEHYLPQQPQDKIVLPKEIQGPGPWLPERSLSQYVDESGNTTWATVTFTPDKTVWGNLNVDWNDLSSNWNDIDEDYNV